MCVDFTHSTKLGLDYTIRLGEDGIGEPFDRNTVSLSDEKDTLVLRLDHGLLVARIDAIDSSFFLDQLKVLL